MRLAGFAATDSHVNKRITNIASQVVALNWLGALGMGVRMDRNGRIRIGKTKARCPGSCCSGAFQSGNVVPGPQ